MQNFISLVLASVLCLSCEGNVESVAEYGTHKVLIKASADNGTRTTVEEGERAATYFWSDDDDERFHVFENGVEASDMAVVISDDLKKAEILAEFPDAVAQSYRYTAFVAGTTDSSSRPSVPESQLSINLQYDPRADILIAEPVEKTEVTDELVFRFNRVIAVTKMTLKGLTPGEVVTSIKINSDEPLTGSYDISGGSFSADKSSISLECCDAADASGCVPFFFITIPVEDAQIELEVTTDKAKYSKTLASVVSMPQNMVTRFGVNLKDCEIHEDVPPVDDPYYTKVTSEPEDWSGDYLIVYESSTTTGIALDGSLPTSKIAEKEDLINVEIESGKIQATTTTNASKFTVSKMDGGYSMKAAAGYYIGGASKSIQTSNSPVLCTFKMASDKSVSIRSNNYTLKYNADARMFRFYGSTGVSTVLAMYRRNATGSSGGGEGGEDDPPVVDTPTKLTMSQVSCTEQGTTSLKFEWPVVAHATGYGVKFNYGEEKIITSTVWVANGLEEGKWYSIQVRAIGDSEKYLDSDYVTAGDYTRTTSATGDVSSKGWYELPVMEDEDKNGVNDKDNTLYYAYHLCAGSEKGAHGEQARNYTVCYSGKYHCPVWVAAPRHSMYVGSASRTDAYGKDPNIPSGIQYSSKSTGGGCNKGHMLGSAERTSSSATNRQVFYYTNIAPQNSSTFNTGGGAWNNLEDFVDGLVVRDTLYEVVGCYFDTFKDAYNKTCSPKTISFGGRSDVAMPTMFYYALLRTKKGNSGKDVRSCSRDELQCVAFVISHAMEKGHKPQAKDMISISDLEKLTGFTYFTNVPNAPKDTFKSSDWGL